MSQTIATEQSASVRAPGTGLDRFALAMVEPTNVRRWYALVLAVCIALIALTVLVLVYVMPEGADVAGTVSFYAKYNTLLRVISALLTVMFIAGAIWSATFISTLWAADTSRNRVYTWAAFISEMLVLGLFFVESGIFAATVLLSGRVPDSTLHALHVVVLVSAALLGPVWIPYTLGALLISRRTGLFPAWLNIVCVLVILMDVCIVTGVFTLSGPMNGENGLIGAGFGVIGPIVWVGGTVAWELVEWAQYRTSQISASQTE